MIEGMSEYRLLRIGAHLENYVASGKLPGAAILITRGNTEVYYQQAGFADVERKKPISRDTIFRYYSMTKPITSAALLTLYEMGMFQLDDPVSRYIPAWKDMRVYESGSGDSLRTRPVQEPMTIKHLLMHTSGLTYGFMQNHPVDEMYRERKVSGGEGRTLNDMVESLADIPLLFEPGSRWSYSVATDVCGYLIQHFSETDLDEFIMEQILEPLEMFESGFCVADEDRDRLAACYSHHPDGFRLQDDPTTSSYHRRPAYLSGGGGMVGTIDDYMNFACMLLGYDEGLEELPILGPQTRKYMLSNHLPGGVDLAAMGQSVFSETSFAGVGFGLGVSVVNDPIESSVLDTRGAAGWGGAASTYFWVDPEEDLAVVFMTQLLPSSTFPIRRELKTLVHQAIISNAWSVELESITQNLNAELNAAYREDESDDDDVRH